MSDPFLADLAARADRLDPEGAGEGLVSVILLARGAFFSGMLISARAYFRATGAEATRGAPGHPLADLIASVAEAHGSSDSAAYVHLSGVRFTGPEMRSSAQLLPLLRVALSSIDAVTLGSFTPAP